MGVADCKGLILSPGFPNNYTPGTHCVWQFFVPAGQQLILEMFDFDVFESPGRNLGGVSEGAESSEEEEPGVVLKEPERSTDSPSTGDECPDDVLYITDLTRFSSRFCGSRGPPGGRLEFSSGVATVEVVMELITNTHRGRGFALLFYYWNHTREAAELMGQSLWGDSGGALAPALPVAIGAAAVFGTAFGVLLCVLLR